MKWQNPRTPGVGWERVARRAGEPSRVRGKIENLNPSPGALTAFGATLSRKGRGLPEQDARLSNAGIPR